MTKLLAGPFGWNSYGIHISLRGNDTPDIEAVLLGYSCYPPAIEKIRTCLKHSNRYDCYVQASWLMARHRQCQTDFSKIGIDLRIDEERTFNRWPKKRTISAPIP